MADYPLLVHEARRIVSAQAHCSFADALVIMYDTARATDITLEELAREIVSHRVRFDKL